MRQLLTVFTDLLFPPSEDEKLLREVGIPGWMSTYRPGMYRQTTYLSDYQHPLIQAAIKENKFHSSAHAATLLGRLLTHWYEKLDHEVVFIPIPLSSKRLRERGHNQVESILNGAGLSARVATDILVRNMNTTPQTKLDRQTRLNNMRGAFTCRPKGLTDMPPRHFVILDDVVTTGATLMAAREAILPHLPTGNILSCLAVAH